MSLLEILASAFIGLGVLTMLTGAFGVVRFPDFYTRLHAAGKGDTLGQGLVLFGLLLISGFGFDSFKLAVIIFFVLILNSTATHGLARAGWLAGMRPWLGRDDDPVSQREGQMSLADRLAVISPVQAAPVVSEEAVEEANATVDASAPETQAERDASQGEDAPADAEDETPASDDVDEIVLELEDEEAPPKGSAEPEEGAS